MKLIGKRIKAVRLQEGLTQTELGNILNVEKSAISHYENAERNIPVDIIIKISEYFDIDTNYLLGLNNEGISKTRKIKLSDEEVIFLESLRKTSTYKDMIYNPENYAKLIDNRIASYKVKM